MFNLPDPAPAFNGEAEGEARREAAPNRLRVRRAALGRECTAAMPRVAFSRGEVSDDIGSTSAALAYLAYPNT